MITGPLRITSRRSGSTPWSAPRQRSPPAVGPLLGGFITTFLSWRVAFLLEALLIVGVLLQRQVSTALEADAQVVSNAQLEELLAGRPEQIQDEIIRINTEARPLALQIALLVPLPIPAPPPWCPAPSCGTVPRSSSRATDAWPETGVRCVLGRVDGSRSAVGVQRRRSRGRSRRSRSSRGAASSDRRSRSAAPTAP
ncbi:hypothetical protein IWX63_002877 [Arthrobacter sp. CAN_A2]|uniref:hypothetical protein n=1 Tax=Arthrobacter sp. CAN_A2 TaxID=2787718 RepID=UPI0018EF893D